MKLDATTIETEVQVECETNETVNESVTEAPEPAAAKEPPPISEWSYNIEHALSVSKAEREYCDIALHLEELKAKVTYARDRLKEASDSLKSLRLRGPEVLPLFDLPAADQVLAACQDANEPAAGRWEGVETATLGLGLVKGIGAKRVEAIIEAWPLLGQLEAARASGELRAMKGVGEATYQAIEDAILVWLSKNRDAAVLADAARPKTIHEWAAELSTGEADQLDVVGSEDAWSQGCDAHQAGEYLDTCPYVFTGPEGSDWIRGWLYEDEKAGGQ